MKINRLKKQKHEYLIHTFSDEAVNGIYYIVNLAFAIFVLNGYLKLNILSLKLNIYFIPILHDGQ